MEHSGELSNAELGELRRYLTASTADDRIHGWLRSLATEVERRRGLPASHADHSMKPHGDALLEGSGSRQGEAEGRR